jgi:hypothetical protein
MIILGALFFIAVLSFLAGMFTLALCQHVGETREDVRRCDRRERALAELEEIWER